MKIKLFKILFISIFAMSSWLSGYSQQYPDSLVSYLEISAKNNPAVQQKFSEYKAALQKVPQAGALADPELSLGLFLEPMELMNGNQVADIRLMQMLPWFGVLRYAKDEMSLMANAKFELFRDTKLQVFYEVERSWYELFKVRKEILVSEKNIEILKTIERIALVRYKAAPGGGVPTSSQSAAMVSQPSQTGNAGGSSGMQGMSGSQGNPGSTSSGRTSPAMPSGSMDSPSGGSGLADLYRIMIEAGDLENNLASLISQERSLLARFNSFLNRPSLTSVFTGETLTADSLFLPLAAIPDTLIAQNPMFAMLEYEGQAYEARKNMVTRMGYPMVGVGVNYSLINRSDMSVSTMNGKDMIMPMVSVTLPIYRKKYRAMQTEAGLLSTAASMNRQSVSNSLQAEYYQALQMYEDAQRRVSLYESQYHLASRSLDLIMKSFAVSASGLTDVLRVQQQTLDYELKQVEAVADLNTAVAWLKRLTSPSKTEQF